jgi:hypothetical protein
VKIQKHIYAIASLAILFGVVSFASNDRASRTTTSSPPIKADNPLVGRTPVFLETSRTIQNNTLSEFLLVYTVPKGKWLVVEQFFLHGHVRSGQRITEGFMDHLFNSRFSPQVPVLVHNQARDSTGTRQLFEANLQGPYYFESGSQVFAQLSRSSKQGGGLLTAGISGYLVDQF